MDKTTLEDPSVTVALAGYVKIKFQAEKPDEPPARAVMQRFDAVGLPDLRDPEAEVVTAATMASRRARPGRFPATAIVLALLCLMYLITYVDRVNIATAAPRDPAGARALATRSSAFVLSRVRLSLSPLSGLRRVGGRSLRSAADAVRVRRHLGQRDDPDRPAGGLATLLLVRVLLGFGEGATFPVATRAMQSGRRRIAAASRRASPTRSRALGNAITPPIVAWLIALAQLARIVRRARLLQPVWVTAWACTSATTRRSIPRSRAAELERLPNRGVAPAARLGGAVGAG